MIVESVSVKNFRSIHDETLHCDTLTALVGPNGSGKSTFLRALEVFYDPNPKIDIEDFYNSDTGVEIVIGVTYASFSKEALELFGGYVQGGKLTVERVFKWEGGKVASSYHGASLQNPDFQPIRNGLVIKDKGKTAKSVYDEIRVKSEYASLPAWSKIGAVDGALATWEAANQDKCIRQRDDGRFFGFTEVGQGYLGRFTRYLFIPAVRDASDDAAEGRGSVLTVLMDMVVRSVIANKESVRKLREDTQQKYDEILKPENLPELQELSSRISGTLRTFVPNASVDLRWLPPDPIKIDLPKADVRLVEDRFGTAVHRTGHGLQRAFILTMLQHLAMVQSAPQGTQSQPSGENEQQAAAISLPSLLLGIEEPELYQHPNRQRHLSKILLQLAQGSTPGVADRTQIIYATHSPLFVGLDRFNQIRLLRKVEIATGKPKATRVVSTSLDVIAEELWKANGAVGEKYTAETLAPRLHSILTPWLNEGFFADAVVLVEGPDDYAAIIGVARTLGKDLESSGIAIIPVSGKRSLDRPAIIFKAFGIPVYLLWDSDGEKGETEGTCEKCERPFDNKPDPAENRLLLRLLGKTEEDWPNYTEGTFACFRSDLEQTMRTEIGPDDFDRLLIKAQADYGIRKRKHALKNPAVIERIVTEAKKIGKTSATLISIVKCIESIVAK